jgi:hypothetical protein
MFLPRFRTQSLMCIALLALCMQMLLPFVHAMQLPMERFGGVALCSSVSQSIERPLHNDSSHRVMQCPLCMLSAQLHFALPMTVALIPVLPKTRSVFQWPLTEGFLIWHPSYTHPQSHAPPFDLS